MVPKSEPFVYAVTPRVTLCYEGPLSTSYPTPAGLFTDVTSWLIPGRARELTVIYDEPPVTGPAEFVDTIQCAGWKTAETKGGWFTCRRDGDPHTVHFGIAQWAPDDPLIGGVALTTAAFHAYRWHAQVGTPYVHTPGVAATVNMRRTQAPHASRCRWVLRDPATVAYWEPPAQISDIRWRARVGRTTSEATWVRWDMRSAYLAAMAAVTLPAAAPRPTGVEPDGPGYVRVDVAALPGRLRSALALLGRPDRQGCIWTTTALPSLLAMRLPVVDSYTAPGGRILRDWAESWRDAIMNTRKAATLGRLEIALKRGYSEAVGLMAVKRGTVYRPDWRHLIIDQVRASMLRRVLRVHELTNLWPTRVDVDSVWYDDKAISNAGFHHSNVGNALGVGERIGNMRYEG